jgi:hypothetical protein
MKNSATIVDAKMTGAKESSYNDPKPKARMRLTVDVELPAPSEPMSIKEWFDHNDRGYDSRAKKALWLKANPAAAETAETPATNGKGKKAKKPAAKEMPWNWSPTVALLEEHMGAEYSDYVETHRRDNQRALRASQDAAMLLLLIGKRVHITIEPAQRAFAQLLRLGPGTAEPEEVALGS